MTAATICPYCRTAFASPEEEMACQGCGTPHHQDCYAENGGCTVFGCTSAPAEEPKLAISAPEVARATAMQPAAVSFPTASITVNGAGTATAAAMAPTTVIESAFTNIPAPEAKNKMTFVLLGIFLGSFGAHNFYAGYTSKAVLQLCITLLTIGFAAPMTWIWAVIEICIVNRDSRDIEFRS